MKAQIISIYRDNLPNAFGVWQLGRTWKVKPLAVFETEAEALAYVANL